MLVKIEAWILIFPGTDFHFPSTSVPPGTFFRLWTVLRRVGLPAPFSPSQRLAAETERICRIDETRRL